MVREMQAVEACELARLNRSSESENCLLDLSAKVGVQLQACCTWIEICLKGGQSSLETEAC
jgi:hypothetical protein